MEVSGWISGQFYTGMPGGRGIAVGYPPAGRNSVGKWAISLYNRKNVCQPP